MPEIALDDSRGLGGKVIAITGGCGDIGAETTARLSSFGTRVIPFDLLSEDEALHVPRNLEPLRTRTLIRATPTNCNARLSRSFRNFIGSIS